MVTFFGINSQADKETMLQIQLSFLLKDDIKEFGKWSDSFLWLLL